MQTYSPSAPSRTPKTSAPGWNRSTALPVASMVPAKSVPTRWPFGRRRPSCVRTRYGVPVSACQSTGFTEAARTRTSTSSSAGAGLSISRSSSTSGRPYASRQIAFTVGILSDRQRRSETVTPR